MATLPPTLNYLDLSSCDMIEFPHFSKDANISLEFIDLSKNKIEGEIPHWIGSVAKSYLNFSHNKLIGGLEQLLWGSIHYLDLQYNMLNGSLPTLMCNSTVLKILNLSHNNLSGVLPICHTNLTQLLVLDLRRNKIQGNIPATLANFRDLETINLNGNRLQGSIPSSFAEFDSLAVLDLGNNQINDTFPRCLETLPNLQVLVLKSNKFYGHINTSSNIEHPFPRLKIIDLSDNEFSGPLPEKYFRNFKAMMNGEVNKVELSYMEHFEYYRDSTVLVIKGMEIDLERILTVFTTIDVSMNEFEGEIPECIGNLVSLRYLNLSHNLLTGHIPRSIGILTVLESLDLSSNELEGEIPHLFSQLVNLTFLGFASNNFSGVLDLKMFSGLEFLEWLDLSDNSLSVRSIIMATLPPKLNHLGLSYCNLKEFPHFSRDAHISLNFIDLSNNKIEGEIPHWIGSVARSYLNLSHNKLIGGLEQLPWSHIEFLYLQCNELNGSLPTLMCNSSSLDILNLSHNNLSGVLPICHTNFTQLSVLDLRRNNILGNIPATLSNFRNLQTINFNGNRLEGSIPSSFAGFDSLAVLDLGNNQINDTFPRCLEALPNLQVLVLKSNKFYGLINTSSNIVHPFPSLRIIDLSDNKFSGPLPAKYFRNFKAMMNGDVNKIDRSYMDHSYYYSDSTALVIKGVEMELVKILTIFTTIDVSQNHFEGEIVESIRNLVSLRLLNLSHNHLRGHIPFMIGNLSMLESLDLSFNQLEGEIPQQLASIYTLARLNLSCNQLSGHIPQGSQFNTFDADSYGGNFGLCGNPLSKKCEHDIVEQESDEDEDNDYFFNGFTWKAVVIGYGCGVVPAFITGYLMLLARKPRWFAGIIGRELGLKIRRMEIRMRY